MKPQAGSYALVLQSHAENRVQVGRWGALAISPGYYIYVGSAFGPGGVKARVSRHFRANKSKHWHIDYLRALLEPVGAWCCYEPTNLEHLWAEELLGRPEFSSIKGFGCSDCRCPSHLFHTTQKPELAQILGHARRTITPVVYRKDGA